MRKLIMLTFLLGCVIMLFVGCENGKKEVNELFSGERYDLDSSGEREEMSRRYFKRPERRSL